MCWSDLGHWIETVSVTLPVLSVQERWVALPKLFSCWLPATAADRPWPRSAFLCPSFFSRSILGPAALLGVGVGSRTVNTPGYLSARRQEVGCEVSLTIHVFCKCRKHFFTGFWHFGAEPLSTRKNSCSIIIFVKLYIPVLLTFKHFQGHMRIWKKMIKFKVMSHFECMLTEHLLFFLDFTDLRNNQKWVKTTSIHK